MTLILSRLLRFSGLLRLNRRGRLLRLRRCLISHVRILGLFLSRLLILSRMSSFVDIVLLLHLVIRIAILRDTEVPILTERQNHVEDGVQEEQANGEANSLPKRDTLFVQGYDANDDANDDQQRAEQRMPPSTVQTMGTKNSQPLPQKILYRM